MPIVTTLHTVLREPNLDQHRVMVELAEISDRLIVMSQHSSQFLQEIFQVPAAKIDVIPHGVPNLAFVDPNFSTIRCWRQVCIADLELLFAE